MVHLFAAKIKILWLQFRKLPFFMQLLLVVPFVSALALTLFVGSMGLAIMGTAIAINSFFAGWLGGLFILVLVKAGIIIAKDR